MPEQLWPLILVALLAGLVASSIPFLVTFDPTRPEGKFVLLINELGRVQDLQATIELTWAGQAEAVRADFMWLRGEGAFRLELQAPSALAGQVFTYQGGQLNHFIPAEGDVGAGVVITELQPLFMEFTELQTFDPQEFTTALRLGTLRVSEAKGKGVVLVVSGQFPGLNLIRQLVLELNPSEESPFPTLADLTGVTLVYLQGTEERSMELRLAQLVVNSGLTLHTVREFPEPYTWVLPPH